MSARDQFKRGFEEKFFGERVADLHTRAFGVGLVGEVFGSEGGAVNTVASGARTDSHNQIPYAFCLRANELVFAHHANAHRVDQRISLVGRVEHDIARDGRNTHAVAVIADSLHNATDEIAHAWGVE